jgi:hypothetical protein
VDLNHRPLGYESNSAAQARQRQPAKRKQTLRSALPELLRFAPLCTPFTDKTRTEKHVYFLLAASNSVDYEFGLVSCANLGVRRFSMQRRLMLHTERLLLDEIARTLRENAAASAGSKQRIAATDLTGLLNLDPRQILIGEIEVYDPREPRPR